MHVVVVPCLVTGGSDLNFISIVFNANAPRFLLAAVSQDSVLSPILFPIFVKNFLEFLSGDFPLVADDFSIISAWSQYGELYSTLQAAFQ